LGAVARAAGVWKHLVVLYLRARKTFEGDPPIAYYRLFRWITKGVPASAMKLGVGVSLDEIAADEFFAMPLIEEERNRLEREQMQFPRN
jgi:hypothetical protein